MINIISKHFKHRHKSDIATLLTNIKNNPAEYIKDEIVGRIAATFMKVDEELNYQAFDLLQQTGQLKIYGGKEVEHSAKKQMETAMALLVTRQNE